MGNGQAFTLDIFNGGVYSLVFTMLGAKSERKWMPLTLKKDKKKLLEFCHSLQ